MRTETGIPSPPRAPVQPSVVAVTVTYGQRAGLCEQVARAALGAGASHVVIVDNGSPPNNKRELSRAVAELGTQVTLISHAENEGSAGGYASGVDLALTRQATHVWLLDDDNVAEPESLTLLLAEYDALDGRLPAATLAYRPDRPYQKRLVEGVPPSAVFPSRSCFMYLHVGDRLRRVLGPAQRHRASAPSKLQMPYGPYGGALLSLSSVEMIGVPDRRLALYEDDTEYLHRITRQGGCVLLVERAVLQDIDPNWLGTETGVSGPSRLIRAESPQRIYHSVRNRVFFERHIYRSSSTVYTLNKFAYLLVLSYSALRFRGFRQFALILRAMRDGEAARFESVPAVARL